MLKRSETMSLIILKCPGGLLTHPVTSVSVHLHEHGGGGKVNFPPPTCRRMGSLALREGGHKKGEIWKKKLSLLIGWLRRYAFFGRMNEIGQIRRDLLVTDFAFVSFRALPKK